MIGYFIYKTARFLSVRLPFEIGFRLAAGLSIFKYYFSPRDRCAVVNNLRQILPSEKHRYIPIYTKEVFVNFGKYLFEFLRVNILNPAQLGGQIKCAGVEHIQNALKQGKGVIVLSAHMGNWELGGILMASLGYPMIAVALPHRHKKVNDLFNEQREGTGSVVVPSLGVAVRRIYEALKNNKIVALVGDRDFANAGKRIPFLGKTKVIPRGPAVLALRTGAVIIPGFVIRQPDGSLIVEFSPAIKNSGSEDQIVAAYASVIEEKIRQYPTQWLMFREFWNE